jgi:hypothetical protein
MTHHFTVPANPNAQSRLMGKIFVGEMMTCVVCGQSEKSDPTVSSNWRCIEANGVPFYICPNEMPPDGASAEQFEAAYLRILRIIVERLS